MATPDRCATWLDGLLAEAGIGANGPRRVLCYPRILGYVFNPLSVWFCHAADGTLKAIIYEVHNTYDRRRHAYRAAGNGLKRRPKSWCGMHSAKDFYVSPFLSNACRYQFRIRPPADNIAVSIHEEEAGAAILNASFAGDRRALDRTVRCCPCCCAIR